MTANQIAYHNALETKRHNLMNEQEVNRHQLVTEALQKWSNQLAEQTNAINQAHYARMDKESVRSHKANEDIARYQAELQAQGIYETERANKERERQNAWQIAETQRMNLANEALKSQSNRIQSAQVSETSRHQKSMEQIEKSLNASLINKNIAQVSEIGANTSFIQARTKTEGWNTNSVIADIDLKHSQSALNAEKTQTEYTNRFVNVSQGTRNLVGTLTDVVKTLVPIASGGAGGGKTFWTEIQKQYK